jgi:hypothetical protein
MTLPNGERAIVDVENLLGYCLNPHHKRGRTKARVFAPVGIGKLTQTHSARRST